MKARHVMRHNVSSVFPDDPVAYAAELMHYERDSCVPVVLAGEHPILVGVITARDIAVRCVARQHGHGCLTRDHMTPRPLQTAAPDEDLSSVLMKMEAADVRRIPVISDDGVFLGMIHERDVGPRVRGRELGKLRQRTLGRRQPATQRRNPRGEPADDQESQYEDGSAMEPALP